MVGGNLSQVRDHNTDLLYLNQLKLPRGHRVGKKRDIDDFLFLSVFFLHDLVKQVEISSAQLSCLL